MNKLREEIQKIRKRTDTWEEEDKELVVLFQKWANECVGEDEKMKKEYSVEKANDVWSRKILRAEIRERIKKLAG